MEMDTMNHSRVWKLFHEYGNLMAMACYGATSKNPHRIEISEEAGRIRLHVRGEIGFPEMMDEFSRMLRERWRATASREVLFEKMCAFHHVIRHSENVTLSVVRKSDRRYKAERGSGYRYKRLTAFIEKTIQRKGASEKGKNKYEIRKIRIDKALGPEEWTLEFTPVQGTGCIMDEDFKRACVRRLDVYHGAVSIRLNGCELQGTGEWGLNPRIYMEEPMWEPEGGGDELAREYVNELLLNEASLAKMADFWRKHHSVEFILFAMKHPSQIGYELLTLPILSQLREGDDMLFMNIGFACKMMVSDHSERHRVLRYVRQILHSQEIPEVFRAWLFLEMQPFIIPPSILPWFSEDCYIQEKLFNAIRQDSIPIFEIEMTLQGKRLGKSILGCIIKNCASSILCHLLKTRGKALESLISIKDLLVKACSWALHFKDGKGALLNVLNTLEELQPGFCRNYVDNMGNNLLFYSLGAGNAGDALEEALINHGCDPEACNNLGLSFRRCKEFSRVIKG